MPWSIAELNSRWGALPPSPHDRGCVVQVAVRPDLDQRAFPASLELSPLRGAIGDRWERRTWMYLPDGRPDPRVQVAVMNASTLKFMQLLTGCTRHPGDTVLVDLDLSVENLPAGARVRVGTAVLEISDVENNACAKFAAAYGEDILQWIRAPANRARRHRGLFASVVQGGTVSTGDCVERVVARHRG